MLGCDPVVDNPACHGNETKLKTHEHSIQKGNIDPIGEQAAERVSISCIHFIPLNLSLIDWKYHMSFHIRFLISLYCEPILQHLNQFIRKRGGKQLFGGGQAHIRQLERMVHAEIVTVCKFLGGLPLKISSKRARF